MTLIIAQTYDKTSLPWQLYQLREKIGQWWEWKISQLEINLPDSPGFSWLTVDLLKTIGWVILCILLVGLGYFLIKLIIPVVKSYVDKIQNLSSANNKPQTKIIPISVEQWKERSQLLARQKNYKEACFCLYHALLELLDERKVIPIHDSRTDGEYQQLVTSLPDYNFYQTLLLTHEFLCFGEREASETTWQNCQEAYQKIAQKILTY